MELHVSRKFRNEARSAVVVFLGAGFSFIGGVPLAAELFSRRPDVDVLLRERLMERVLTGWDDWHRRNGGTPEQYLTHLEQRGGKPWNEAVWYVALAVTLQTPRVRICGRNPTIIGHSLVLNTGVEVHEAFWTAVFRLTTNVTVLTTNYDILVERGLRVMPRPQIPRIGFHYGDGRERLKGSVPGIFHNRDIELLGSVPLLKLHGSVSWAFGRHGIDHFHDCRPAIRGDAAIIAPVTEKSVPTSFHLIWKRAAKALREANIWIVVGYSFPKYDMAVNQLFKTNVAHMPRVHIINPDTNVAQTVRSLLPNANVNSHRGLPDLLQNIHKIFD